jgi:MYXO-CTERM domain-containing protein
MVLGLTGQAARAQAQIDWFQADLAQVTVGGTVNFGVGWSIQGSSQNGGGSDLNEPMPVESYQEWVQNWYWTETLTPLAINLQAGGLNYNESLSGPEGSSQSGIWGFSISFTEPGPQLVQVSGDFSVLRNNRSETQLATRYCYNSGDFDGGVYLQCDSWSYSYPQFTDAGSWGGSLNSLSVQVEVVSVPVPEPAAAALWLTGLAALLALARRQRRDG